MDGIPWGLSIKTGGALYDDCCQKWVTLYRLWDQLSFLRINCFLLIQALLGREDDEHPYLVSRPCNIFF